MTKTYKQHILDSMAEQPCPYVVTSKGGTSYCGLAEDNGAPPQPIADQPGEGEIEKAAKAMQKNFPVVQTGIDDDGKWSVKSLELEVFIKAIETALPFLRAPSQPLSSPSGEESEADVERVASAIWEMQQNHDGFVRPDNFEKIPLGTQIEYREIAKAAINALTKE